MDHRTSSSVLVLMLILRCNICLTFTSQDTVLAHYAVLDPAEKVHLFWTFDRTKIAFEIQVETLGYVGIGLSPNGDMPGSDIVIGGVYDDGKVYLRDSHATGQWQPVVDDSQDWRLISGSQNQTHTTLRFWRPLDTCDEHDRSLKSETTRLIWAYNEEDADSEGIVKYHSMNRGSKSIFLLNPQKTVPEIPADSIIVDFQNNQATLTDADTSYWCEAFAVPQFDRKHHVIKFEPIIQPGHEALVHHMGLLGCYGNMTQETVGLGRLCYDESLPNIWQSCSMTSLFAWAVGGGPFYFPEHVGFPLGFDEDPPLLLLQTHYDNPSRRNDFVDSSGLRLTLSPRPRQYDAALLSTGLEVSSSQVIPPFAERFRTDGHCLPECLTQALTEHSSINIFAGVLHTHLIGTAIRFRHFREGVEQRVVIEDNNYDFNFQEMRMLDEEVTVKPGDNLVTECDYNSMGRTHVTFGGQSTRNEMCLTFAMYYPRTPLVDCHSSVDPEILAGFANVSIYPNMTVKEPIMYEGLHYTQVLEHHVDWRDESVRERLQEVTTDYNNPVLVPCYRDQNHLVTKLTVPKITKSLPEKMCEPWTDRATSLTLHPLIILVISFAVAFHL